MGEKAFDIFVIYSDVNQEVIEKIAEIMERHKVRVWYRKWQMKPGDTLQERIIHGIANADYMLLVLSENSVNSYWVRHELNATLIEEIENANVKVISCIVGKVDHQQVPECLHTKNHVDFLNHETFQKSIEALLRIVHPERERRKELLIRLQNPIHKDAQTLQNLRNIAMRGRDQAIQAAALNGIAKIGGPAAVLAITERVLDTYGVSAIAKAIKTLEKLRNDGGLLALSATLISDRRFYFEKVQALAEGAKKLNANDTHQILMMIYNEPGNYFEYKDRIIRALEKLSVVSLDDIRHGAILARNITSLLYQSEHVNQPEKAALDQARLYAEQRVPGLINLIEPIEGRVSWSLAFI